MDMINKKENPALLLVDIQKGFDQVSYWGNQRNHPEAEKNAAKLLHCWRELNLPLFHIQHASTNPESPLAEGKTGHEIHELVKPLDGEPVFKKKVNSAFIGTPLLSLLRETELSTLVICGLTTDHCVSTTTRMASNYGFKTFLVEDAAAAFNKSFEGQNYSADMIHKISLATLKDEFAQIVKTDDILDLMLHGK